jgi:hypothetical protein
MPLAADPAGRHSESLTRSTSFSALRDVATSARVMRRGLMDFSITMRNLLPMQTSVAEVARALAGAIHGRRLAG